MDPALIVLAVGVIFGLQFLPDGKASFEGLPLLATIGIIILAVVLIVGP